MGIHLWGSFLWCGVITNKLKWWKISPSGSGVKETLDITRLPWSDQVKEELAFSGEARAEDEKGQRAGKESTAIHLEQARHRIGNCTHRDLL